MTRSHVLDRLDLDSFVTSIDAAFADSDDNVLLRLTGEKPDLGLLQLHDRHPLEELLGFDAPPSWQALGLRCGGWALRLDDVVDVHSGDYLLAIGPDGDAPAEVRFTMLVDRDGRGAGVMREDDRTTSLYGAPDGLLGDTCRRALGLPTTGPPPTTTELWLRVWLDRLVESLSDDEEARSFAELAALHPAVLGDTAVVEPEAAATPNNPDELADATLLLAATWTWARLRRDPDLVDTGGPPLPVDTARWMDDGMFARWLLADLPRLDQLLRQLDQVLPLPSVQDVGETLALCGVSVPGVER